MRVDLVVRLRAPVLPGSVPDMNTHRSRCYSIDDDVPGVGNRIAPLIASGRGGADTGLFENQIERALDAFTYQFSRARVLRSYVSKGVNIGLLRPWRPFKPLGGACGHVQC